MIKQSATQEKFVSRPPIVAVLGHVDHGKTTLLDSIRKTNIAAREFGGITQHIGAYQIEVTTSAKEGKKLLSQKITFIDTPGHEAFAKMRGRGARVADIAILVVAANDGVMPQTIESIKLIQNSKIPCIVVINKIDLPDIQIEKIKKQLVKLGFSLEEYGGETPVILISAKKETGIDKLLEMILLLAELYQIKEDAPSKLNAVVIESTLSKNRGPVATIILRSGNLSIGDVVICENQEFRVRALTNWHGQNLSRIYASYPAEILGWKNVPPVGSLLYNKTLTESKIRLEQKSTPLPSKLPSINNPPSDQEKDQIKILLKADTLGTYEAIFENLPHNVISINGGVGNVTESDVLLAKTVNALVIGFNVKPSEEVIKLAESEKVIIKIYHIIYELIKEIAEVVEAANQGNLAPILGEAKVLAVFTIKNQLVAGIKVTKGRTARGDQIKIIRGDKEIGRARIKSLRHGKVDITRAEQGSEAGVLLSQNIEILTGDSIISIG